MNNPFQKTRTSVCLVFACVLNLAAQTNQPGSENPKDNDFNPYLGSSDALAKPSNDKEESIQAYLGKGLVAEESDKTEAAIKWYKMAVEDYQSQRESAAQAVYRLAEIYRKLGADQTSREYYQRILTEFKDLSELVELSRGPLGDDISPDYSRFGGFIGGGGYGGGGLAADPYGGTIQYGSEGGFGGGPSESPAYLTDPTYQKLKKEVEQSQFQLDQLNQKRMSVEMEKLNHEQRLAIASNANPLHLPAKLNPGAFYESLKNEYDSSRLNGSSAEPTQIRNKKLQDVIYEWFQTSFIPQIEEDLKAADLELKLILGEISDANKSVHDLTEQLRAMELQEAGNQTTGKLPLLGMNPTTAMASSDVIDPVERAYPNEDPDSMIQSQTLRQYLIHKTTIQSQLIELQTLLGTLREKHGDELVRAVNSASPNSQLPGLIGQMNKVDQELAQKSASLSIEHPSMKELTALKETIKAQMDKEVQSVLQGLEAQIMACEERIAYYNRLIEETAEEMQPGSVAVMGAVKKPGSIHMPKGNQGMSIIEAISAAGDFSKTANTKKIQLFRNGEVTIYSLDELLQAKRADTLLKPGDIIRIGESFF